MTYYSLSYAEVFCIYVFAAIKWNEKIADYNDYNAYFPLDGKWYNYWW